MTVGPDRHPYERDLAVDDIDDARTTTTNPQTHGIGERFNQTLLDECDRVAFESGSRELEDCRPTRPFLDDRPYEPLASVPLVLRHDADAHGSR